MWRLHSKPRLQALVTVEDWGGSVIGPVVVAVADAGMNESLGKDPAWKAEAVAWDRDNFEVI